ncbi:MAG: type II/IV secretion system protein [Verrucomicrobia bacterium]|nr:type II/IV secretion system protein [Verrucomicrobiota bacterium]
MTSEEKNFLFQELGFTDPSAMTSQNFCQGAAALLGVEASLLDSFECDLSLKKILPSELAIRCQAVPLVREENQICVALVDPFDIQSLELLRFFLDEPIVQIVAPPERVKELLNNYCGSNSNSFTPVADHVEQLLEHAMMTQASDLHLDPSEHDWTVRYRIDGVFQESLSFSKSVGLAIASRLKLMAHLNIAEQRRAQDGRLEYHSHNALKTSSAHFRLATLPTQFGESLVLRLLDRHTTSLHFAELPFSPKMREALLKILEEPHGLFIVTGPTGSGKTTTLYSCLQYLHNESIKIITVEDPVEYELDGVLQIPINEAIGLSFGRALRSLLRHDPDIIMIGETRDATTARMALQASLTGHRVMTTLHTSDAVGAIVRILEMGGEATTLATTLRGVLAQRLLRTICPSCRIAYHPDEKLLAKLGFDPTLNNLHFYRGSGCEDCDQTGYAGRHPIFELFLVTDEIQSFIHQKTSHLLLREKAMKQGMIPLRTEALRLLCEGVTTPEEVLQWT